MRSPANTNYDTTNSNSTHDEHTHHHVNVFDQIGHAGMGGVHALKDVGDESLHKITNIGHNGAKAIKGAFDSIVSHTKKFVHRARNEV
jgi:ERCC4-type nuclease